MTRDEALATLRRHEAELRRQGVARAAIFGSIARGDTRPGSDLDVMVEIDPAAPIGIWEYSGIIQFIAELFPLPVDVAEKSALKPHIRPSAERDAVYAF